ncbi:gamma-glutamyl-gamma-aminobutyrate hydrolase family protein [Accumulibacter sp.]|uniref:type 1 glutamine amidotransferase n=1 Tax=Accumulibacter sp. TaxID=2053492 RepID=UPI001AC7A8E7|nr:gamma-glutamyl-gamma-aminobutyrate hydrolase family protein [Accumulibacter sp.]MBN8455858.1 gamma-glutamyl-gamma-aminobutyrate hydrolase family protein [Accumulibacter sp.]MBO3705913.1 gamma-glutamyl-gamma-aminobutyrate hydrolase family protein [Candidatus Accumulibacter conexus]
MKAHVLQHVSFEGLGSIDAWLKSRGAAVSTTQFFESTRLPAVADFDLLIALGGPMSVNDEDALPWLRDEKRLVREAVQRGKSVLGICLGAQLIASALGARVYPGTNKEIGWFPIYAIDANPEDDRFAFPDRTDVFHWHGETFDLPDGAVHLARSAGCLHQAFQIGSSTMGLQFHLETTPASAAALIAHCQDELVADRYIQSEERLRAVAANRYDGINVLMASVLDYLTRDVS